MKRHHYARPVGWAAAPRAARYNHRPRPDEYGLPGGPSPRAHVLAPLPGASKPPRKPRRPATPKQTLPPGVLVYRQQTSSYLASFGNIDLSFQLYSQPHALSANLPTYPVQYLCRPQIRYTSPHQCELMLQSPRKEFLSGLRLLDVSEQCRLAGINSISVGDYKANRHDRTTVGATLVALYGKPDSYGTPGWLLLLVSPRPYSPKHRNANASAAAKLVRELLPSIRAWLQPLLAGEPGPLEPPF